jgi:hypothetical protein
VRPSLRSKQEAMCLLNSQDRREQLEGLQYPLYVLSLELLVLQERARDRFHGGPDSGERLARDLVC